ncbi:glycosyltransferase [Lactobacillus crispatus]|uniref:glycosyltransferase n=1 Tax=Bacillota TaxID=1239 RepID=UPI0024B158FD|nr:glycosyltransferase [Thomasclavelia spiroformis]
MIFVTVGTHEQPFNRLIKKVDDLVADGSIKDEVIMQTGFSTYKPEHCKWQKMMSYDEMQQNLKDARIVITHGGPSSFIEALQFEKIPIVVPRQEKFHEHVNNHQVEFTKLIVKRMNNIIPVYDIDDLLSTINDYVSMIKTMNNGESSNNKQFNINFEKLVGELVKK